MSYYLFIDDERMPQDVTWIAGSSDCAKYQGKGWVIARNLDEVKHNLMVHGMPVLISFDHDLGENTPTGYDIAKYICEEVMNGTFILPFTFRYLVHSKNPVGKKNIEEYMRAFLNFWVE